MFIEVEVFLVCYCETYSADGVEEQFARLKRQLKAKTLVVCVSYVHMVVLRS